MEIHERLRKARINAGYEHAQDAANAFGWSAVTYRAHEAGDRGIKKSVAERYSAAFKVSFDWLYLGREASTRETAEIIDIWSRIPLENRDAARNMLESLSKKNS